MRHAEMVELNELQKREHAEICAKYEAQGQRYRDIAASIDQAINVFIEGMNAPWRQLEAEIRAMDREGV